MTKKLLIIIIAVVVVLLGGAAAFFFIRQNAPAKPVETTEYSPGEAFVTNIYGTDYLIKINVMLEIRTDDAETIALKNNIIRDTVIRSMRSQEEELYKQADTLEQMSVILREALNATLAPYFPPRLDDAGNPVSEFTAGGKDVTGMGPVLDVYFAEFVMQ